MADVLAKLSPPEVAAFYARLADGVDKNKGALQVSLAALMLRRWLANRTRGATVLIDPPSHLVGHRDVLDTASYHRRVYLTQEKARVGSSTKWAGIVPRLLGSPGFQKWDGLALLRLDYQSLVELPLRYQLTGDDADRDLLYALHGFQLKTYIAVTGAMNADKTRCTVKFVSFEAEVSDTYDWDYSEHLTVPNPDYQSKVPGAVEPGSKSVVVYHSNAKRIEDAGLAAPYEFRTRRWAMLRADLTAPAEVRIQPPGN